MKTKGRSILRMMAGFITVFALTTMLAGASMSQSAVYSTAVSISTVTPDGDGCDDKKKKDHKCCDKKKKERNCDDK